MSVYSLFLLESGKPEECIIESETDLGRVRSIASGRSMTKRLAKGLGRRLEIRRDGKVMSGGQNALDALCYEKWLEDNQEE